MLKGKFLKTYRSKDNYESVSLIIGGKKTTKRVHHLMAITFLENPENKITVNHKNRIRYDNRLENLEWNTYSENTKHGWDNGRTQTDKQKNHTKNIQNIRKRKIMQLTQKEGILCRIYDSLVDAANICGLSQHNISSCARGKRSHCGGYVWKYL